MAGSAAARATVPDVAGAAALRDALEQADFRQRLTGGPACELFLTGLTLTRARAEEALGDLAPLELAGFLESDGDSVRAAVRVEVLDDLLLVSDRPAGAGRAPDVVTGLNNAVHVLRNLTVRAPVATAMDLGTGFGVQALSAAAHCGSVLGTDVNPRALAYCRLNAELNGLGNVEVAEGDLFEPARGRRFGLVVSNPPYVISPESSFAYRDGGLPGDEFSRAVAQALPAHLEEGGTAQVICNWVWGDEDWSARPTEWLADSGCDVLVLGLGHEEALPYASAWNTDLWLGDHDAFAATVREWLDHYEHAGIERIAFGALVLRRRPDGSRTRVRAIQVGRAPEHAAGEHVRRLLEGFDPPPAEELLASRVRLVPGVAVEQGLTAAEETFVRRPARVHDPNGLALEEVLAPPELRALLDLGAGSLAEAADAAGCEREAAAAAAARLLAAGLASAA